ncbi:hypothetical protein KY332_04320 [Candidatus Woesearchaeota archaeon]|nr:hypothetical protein [Candidatus Woesearchaeota archaeon]
MERFQEHRDKAKRNVKIADHMLLVTFPLVKDTKLLLAVIENIFLSYTNAVAAILHFERLYKKIPPFQDTFESKMNMFKERIVIKHGIDKSYLFEIQDIRDSIIQHRKSPVEFKRGDKFVICSENYRIKTISANDIRKYLDKAKVFIEVMDNILGEDGLSRPT